MTTNATGSGPSQQDIDKLSVADVTDWLQAFSGPVGQQQLTEQGTIGLADVKAEATSLKKVLDSIVRLIPGGSSDGVGSTSTGRRPPSGAGRRAEPFVRKMEAVEKALAPSGSTPPDPKVVQGAIQALRDRDEIAALPPDVRHDATIRIAKIQGAIANIAGMDPESDAILNAALHQLSLNNTPSDREQFSLVQPYQRVILEGDRGLGAGDNPDLGRIVQRVVSEAFAQSTFLGNGQRARATPTPYGTTGIGPVSMYAQNLASIPPDQRAAAAAGLTAQVSTEQAVLQQQIGPAVSAAIATVERLQPLSTIIDLAEFSARRSAVSSDLSLLLAEAGRADGPRRAVVSVYSTRLVKNTQRLLNLARVEPREPRSSPRFDSAEEESQRAAQQLLVQQLGIVGQLWTVFLKVDDSKSYSRAVIGAQRLLEATSSTTREWINRLDGFGLTQDERRIAFIGNPSASLRQALTDPDVADMLKTLDSYVEGLAGLTIPTTSAADSGTVVTFGFA